MKWRKAKDHPEEDGLYYTDIGYIEFRDGLWRNRGQNATVHSWIDGTEGEWFDAEKQMPEENVGVLVFIPEEDNHITSGMWDVSQKWVLLDEYRTVSDDAPVTHWMPLPNPPVRVEKN